MAGTGFQLAWNPDTVLAPDFAFIRRERVGELPEIDGFIPIPPDLCVEVVSSSDRWSEVVNRVHEWLDFGTRVVIVIDPKSFEVTAYRSRDDVRVLTEHETLVLEDLLPGWSLPLEKIFRA